METSADPLAAEQETLIQQIAWELDPRSALKANRAEAEELADDRRGDIEDMLRGFRVMTRVETLKVGALVKSWRALEDRREALPGPKTMHLRLIVPGASEQQLSRGLKAAAGIFSAAEVAPHEAARASALRDIGDDLHGFDETREGYPQLTVRDHEIADVWLHAGHAAVATCCAGWTVRPRDAGLSLVRNLPAVLRRGPYIEFEAG